MAIHHYSRIDSSILNLHAEPERGQPKRKVYAPVKPVPAYYHSSSPLGDAYGQRLNLLPREVAWLNKFTPPNDPFLRIEVAREATVRLYLVVMNELEQQCKEMGSTLAKDAKQLEEATEHRSYPPYWKTSYVSRSLAGPKVAAPVYLTIFQRCENAVRARYDTAPINDNYFFSGSVGTDYSFELYFGDIIRELLPALALTVPLPDEELEQTINHYHTSRWEPRYEKLLALLPANSTGFVAGVYALGRQNERNSMISQLYLEAARQVADLVREPTVELYFHYLYYGRRRYPFKPKPLYKRHKKKLFPLPEHLERFEQTTLDLLNTRGGGSLAAALDKVPAIYYKERRKIELDMGTVQAVRQQHAGTVELLNEYLGEQPESGPGPVTARPPTPAKAAKAAPKASVKAAAATAAAHNAQKTSPGPGAPAAGAFAPTLGINATQQELLRLFAAHGLTLTKAAVDTFAQQHGALRNQLLDGLNEACYELLDDVLLEETDDTYTIYEPYYRRLTTV